MFSTCSSLLFPPLPLNPHLSHASEDISEYIARNAVVTAIRNVALRRSHSNMPDIDIQTAQQSDSKNIRLSNSSALIRFFEARSDLQKQATDHMNFCAHANK
jgi:hypothetical protein